MRAVRLSVALTTLTLMLASAGEALACSCMPSGPPCQGAFEVDAVFAGTVSSISAIPAEGPPLRPNEARLPRALRVEFVDVQGFRGVQGAALTILTAGSGPACGYTFTQGQRYLVYASRNSDGTGLITGICSRTRLLADAGEDLRFLQGLPAERSARARIYGAVVHSERDPWTGAVRATPVPNVIVTASGPAGAFNGSTDAAGRYEVMVPPGKYEVSAVLPAAFSAQNLLRTVELRDPRACFVADFHVRFDGLIRD